MELGDPRVGGAGGARRRLKVNLSALRAQRAKKKMRFSGKIDVCVCMFLRVSASISNCVCLKKRRCRWPPGVCAGEGLVVCVCVSGCACGLI